MSMNIFQNFSIRSRFNIITITVLVLILFILTFFIFTLNKASKYNNFNEDISKLKTDYINMRRFEQHFLLRYSEDANFFITGENIYIKKLKSTSSNISSLLSKLSENSITKDLKLTDIINEIETIHNNYISTFNELTLKTYKKGSFTTGIIGNLKSSQKSVYKTASSQEKNRVSKMIEYSDDYLLTNDEKYYSNFLKEYEQFIQKSSVNDTITIDVSNNRSKNFIQSLSSFKNNFSLLIKINKELGLTYKKGLEGKLRDLKFTPLNDLVNIVNESKLKTERKLKINLYIFFSLVSILVFVIFWRISNSIITPLNKLGNFIEPLGLGILPEKETIIEGDNEISKITKNVNSLISGLKKTTNFAIAIGQSKYIENYEPLSKQDALGNALIEMQENLVSAKKEEEKRKQEDDIRTWTNVGLTKFNDILRQSQGNIEEMSITLISELVKFINANQGGFFVFNDEDEDNKYLELTASYAYGHEKKKQKIIYPGEGIVGTVAIEKETVYMTEIPETYITISSGLGSSNPRSLLIIPMIVEDEIVGVIELASFNRLEKHEIKFVETLAENIASSLSISKINQKTAHLFEQSKRQTELMKVQEEEMRQNYEELQQVQETSLGRAAEMTSILSAIDSSSYVIDIDIEGRITSVNRALLELMGVPETSVNGAFHKEFVQSEDKEKYNIFWEKLISGENLQQNEHIVIEQKDFWFSVVYAPIMDADETVMYIMAIATDLTESKKLEIELKDKERKLIQNIEEINKAHREAEKKQHILENTNAMLTENEKTLHSAIETAMKQRKELAKKIAEIAEEDALTTSLIEGINQTNITINIDLDGVITSANRRFDELFGYERKEINNTKIKNIFSNKYIKSKDYTNLWESLKSGNHVYGTYNFIGKNKQNIFLQGTFTAIKNIRNKVKEIYFVGFNTTDLIEKSEELKARETELQFQIEDMEALQEQTIKQQEELTIRTFEIIEKEADTKSRLEGFDKTNIIIEFDKDRKIQSVNRKFTETFGYNEKESLNRNCQFIVHEQVQKSDKFRKIWENLEKGEIVTDTFNFINKEGSKVFVYGTFTPIKDSSGVTKNVILVGFDITNLTTKTEELKARETELEFQIEDMRELQKQTDMQQDELTKKSSEISEKEADAQSRLAGINETNIIIEFDKDRKITLANKQFTKTFGYKESYAKNRNCQFIVPEQVQKSDKFRGIWEDLGNGKTVTDTFNFINKDGNKIFVYGTFTPIKDSKGKTKNVILIGFDITELVTKTEELRARETELQFQIEELQELKEKFKKD